MQDRDHSEEQEHFFSDSIIQLQKVNKKMAALNLEKEELTTQIISALGHKHTGQKSYEYGVWKIEVKTPVDYALNKKLYQQGSIVLPDEFNPVKESIAYAVDKRLYDKYMYNAPQKVRKALIDLIDLKPRKAGITIKDRA